MSDAASAADPPVAAAPEDDAAPASVSSSASDGAQGATVGEGGGAAAASAGENGGAGGEPAAALASPGDGGGRASLDAPPPSTDILLSVSPVSPAPEDEEGGAAPAAAAAGADAAGPGEQHSHHRSPILESVEHAVETVEHVVGDILSPEPRRPREVTRLVPARLTVEDFDDLTLEETLRQEEADAAGVPRRTELPVKKTHAAKEASIWSILKKNMGKNLSKISMPVAINEPLSVLQRMCEDLEHCHLLDKAADAEDPALQLLYVAAFAVSGYSNSFYRAGRKPFNPLLGETFDYVDLDRKYRFVAEQVSHHPPMSASFAQSQKWEMSQESGGETRFRGTCLKIKPTGRARVKLFPSGNIFEWCKVTTSVEDIMSGNRWCDHYGTMVITHDQNKNHAVVTFTESSMFKKDKRRDVIGQVFVPQGAGDTSGPKFTFKGKWNTELVCPELGDEVLFRAPTVSKERVEQQYGFSEFACQLNALPPDESPARARVSPTDSRLRPDQRMHESCDAGADEKKLELEQAQRDRRHAMEAEGQLWVPRYFARTALEAQVIPVSPKTPRKKKAGSKPTSPLDLATHTPDPTYIWRYSGAYWAHKAKGKFSAAPSLW